MGKIIIIINRYKCLLFTFLSIAIVYLNLLYFTGNVCGGNVNWTIWPAQMWGIPKEIIVGQDMTALFDDKINAGWDGQFYYYISNDLLGEKDTPSHIDSPSYRYQRIGLPLCAWGLSKVFFANQVSVTLFIFTQLLIVSLATFCFAKYLKDNKMSMLYVLPWLFSFGVQITLQNSLVDAAADSFFICAFIFLLKERTGWYSFFMTLACLTREGYASIAAMFFLIILIKSVKCNMLVREKVEKCALFAIPGIAIAGWIAYVTLKFQVAPSSQATGILSLPFLEFFRSLRRQVAQPLINSNEIIGLIIYIFALFLSAYLIFRLKRRCVYILGLAVYILMLTCYGRTVMYEASGYLKGISVLFALIPIFMSLDKNLPKVVQRVCFVFLLVELVASVCFYSNRALGFYPYFSANKYNGVAQEASIAYLNGNATLNGIYNNNFKMLPLQKYFFYKESATVHITVVNNSASKWSQLNNEQGQYAVYVQGQWFQGDKLIKEDQQCQLSQDVLPGQSINMDMQTVYPGKGEYTYKVRLIQRRHDIAENVMKEKVNID